VRLADLITDAGTGMVSHTKLWANVAYATATAAFAYMSYAGTASADIWLIYLASIGASATLSKLFSLKYGLPAATIAAQEGVKEGVKNEA